MMRMTYWIAWIRRAGAAFVLAASLPAVTAPAIAAGAPTFESVWQTVNAKPNIKVIDEPRDVRIEVPDEQAIYFFTRPGQPEYPGVIKRAVVKVANGLAVQSEGHCFGDAAAQAAFGILLAKFKAQDAAIGDKMRN